MFISVVIATVIVGVNATINFVSVLASLFYLKNFLHWGDIYGPLWSLSAEEQFYLVFPILLVIFLRYKNKKTFSNSIFVLIAIIWGVVLVVNYPNYSWNRDGILNLVVFRPSMILVGCLVSLNYNNLLHYVSKYTLTFSTTLVCLVGLCIKLQFPGFAACSTALLILLLDSHVTQTALVWTAVKKILQSRPMRIMGLLSYSIYIWHMPLIFIFYTLNLNPHEHVLQITLLVFVASYFSFYWIEVPLQRFFLKMKM
jgi:peptidoglycan/LPS O-acetylase OafA/YrhL